jgi:hypothetical protein
MDMNDELSEEAVVVYCTDQEKQRITSNNPVTIVGL